MKALIKVAIIATLISAAAFVLYWIGEFFHVLQRMS